MPWPLSDAELILLALAGFYLWECLLWLPEGTLCLVSPGGVRRAVCRVGSLFANDRGALLALGPSPSTEAMTCALWPVAIAREGISSYVSAGVSSRPAPPLARYFAYDEIRSVEASGSELRVNGEVFVEVGLPAMARTLALWIDRLRRAAVDEREPLIRQMLAQTMDRRAIQSRFQEFREAVFPLSLVTWGLFLYTFVLAPLWMYGVVPLPLRSGAIAAYVLGFFGLWGLAMLLFRRAHGRLFPAEKHLRAKHLSSMLFCPATAMRAVTILSREILVDYHPVAVAGVLARTESFRELAASVLRDLVHPVEAVDGTVGPERARAEDWFRGCLRQTLKQYLRERDVDPAELLRPPVPESELAKSYCPRCHGQFEIATGTCSVCLGVELEPVGCVVTKRKAIIAPATTNTARR